MFTNKIFRRARDLIFTVICVNFIEVKEFEVDMRLNVFTSGYENEYFKLKSLV